MQLSELLPEMFRRFDVDLLDEKLHFAPQLSQRGLDHMRVRFTPAQ
jgi:cytochrome P450